MKVEVNDKIRITNKMNDWSMEYQEGDIFTVESTWYGGVNVTSKTGVPISLDEVEYEVLKTEDSSGVSGKEEKKVLLHADTKKGLIRALKARAELFRAWEQEGQPGKIQILAEDQAVCGCRDREEIGEKIKELTGKGGRILVCKKSMAECGTEEQELPGGAETVPWGISELLQKQAEGYLYIKF